MNLRDTPTMLNIKSFESCIANVSNQEDFKKYFTWFADGVLYRSKRVCIKIKLHIADAKGNASNDSYSDPRGFTA